MRNLRDKTATKRENVYEVVKKFCDKQGLPPYSGVGIWELFVKSDSEYLKDIRENTFKSYVATYNKDLGVVRSYKTEKTLSTVDAQTIAKTRLIIKKSKITAKQLLDIIDDAVIQLGSTLSLRKNLEVLVLTDSK